MWGHRELRPNLVKFFGEGKVGFLVVLGEFGPPGSALGFCSNINRKDLVAMLKEVISTLEKPLDYVMNVRDEDIPG